MAVRLLRRSREQRGGSLYSRPAQKARPTVHRQHPGPWIHGREALMRSLRVRLILMLGLAIATVAALQFATSFHEAMQQANRLFDYHMQQMAFALQDSSFEQNE